MKIAIIGGGNMGSAIARALEQSGESVFVYDSNEERRTASLKDAMDGADAVILAVKPQDFDGMMAAVKPHMTSDPLVISIAAGVLIKKIREGLETERVVRVMPNIPAQIGKGISGWYAGIKVSDDEKKTVRRILQSFGEEVEVGREELLDAVTALSGSGPAYVFLFLEALAAGGIDLGLDRAVAEKLALHTVFGACELVLKSGESFDELLKKVASKGGTTESALAVFEDRGFSAIVADAMRAAMNRAKELQG